jgi:AcrR family transcriptional regulator
VDSTRDRLVAAAARLLDRGGPAAVTLREVGRLAGVSHNAPYKHFAGKEALLAAVAARELARLRADASADDDGAADGADGGGSSDGADGRPRPSPAEGLRRAMLGYVAWAEARPARFKLVFGAWAQGSDELAAAAEEARAGLVGAVAAAQAAGELPGGDPERTAALVQAVAHGAADLALAGHLSREAKGGASPSDLVDDLFAYLRAAAR